MSVYEGALDALLYGQDEHEHCDRALLRIADEQAAWRACLALSAIGFAFQRVVDHLDWEETVCRRVGGRDRDPVLREMRAYAKHPEDESRGGWDEIEESSPPPARDLTGEPT